MSTRPSKTVRLLRGTHPATRRTSVVLVALACACDFRAPERSSVDASLASAPAASKNLAAEAGNAFGFDLYHRLETQEGNLFFSPFSISTALAMTYAGAAGHTEREMAAVLHFPPERERLHESYEALLESLKPGAAGGAYRLHLANRLWGQRGSRYLEPFLRTTRKRYGAQLEPMDFAGDAEGSRRTINTWVEKKTEGKIQDLLLPGMINHLTELVLTNAIYFHGAWAARFDTALTSQQAFHVSRERTVEIPLMLRSAEYAFAKVDGLSILELPYRGNRLTMVVLLPDSVDGLSGLESQLSGAQAEAWLSSLRPSKVNVFLPRFRVASRFILNEPLQAMGMTSAFRSDADFSGMTGRRDLFIGVVVHKGYVDVKEEGTEAAAATAVVVTRSFGEVGRKPVFRADHPFVFLIRDKDTSSILFLGRIEDPSVAGV